MVTEEDLYYYIFDIRDPEFAPYKTLEDLQIVKDSYINVATRAEDGLVVATITFRPTASHCKSVLDIGLSIYYRLSQFYLPDHKGVKVVVQCLAGSHNEWETVNRQLRDKERIKAAFENINIRAKLDEWCNHNE